MLRKRNHLIVNRCCSFLRSSIGKKTIVAITGLIMVGFVIAHLIGNLQIFLGPGDATHPAQINSYAKLLKDLGEFIWLARITLLLAVAAHIITTIQLTLENRAAKGDGYQHKASVQAKRSTKTMMWSGSYILCFIIFHLAHYTLFLVHPEFRQLHDAHGLHDVYAMLLIGFSNPFVSAFYILGMLLLCSHLSHGIGSLTQTLGIQTTKLRCCFQCGGRLLAILLAIGYLSIPIAILAGYGSEYRKAALAILATHQ